MGLPVTLRDLNLLIALCLNVAFVLSKGVTSPCRNLHNGLCSQGQHVVWTGDSEYNCVDCPLGTYLDFQRHSCESCKSHSHPLVREIVIQQGSKAHDNVIVCREGYFRGRTTESERRAPCEKCQECEDGTWEAVKCSPEHDRLCCSGGMMAARVNGRLGCAPRTSRVPRQGRNLRRERSSGSGGSNATVLAPDNTDRAADPPRHGSHPENNQDPAHGYSRVDYEAEYQHNKAEFPVWARILCAGVAIGVFLFYLGVGIPCNACGSLDKLRALRNWMVRRDSAVVTEEQMAEKPPVKPKISSDPV